MTTDRKGFACFRAVPALVSLAFVKLITAACFELLFQFGIIHNAHL